MPVVDLLRDARINPPALDRETRMVTVDFVRRRVRRLLELNPGDADPARRGDITTAATPALANLLADELPKVAAAARTIAARVAADGAHLALDPAAVRRRGTKRPPLALRDARANRRRLVRSIVHQAAAVDIRLADPAHVEALHRLCDRRLRIVERMVYDVGRAGARAWSRAQITAHPGGPWPDGYERIFEYPRLPRSRFLAACRSDTLGRCTPPMQDWGAPTGDPFLVRLVTANPQIRTAWRLRGEYELDFDPASGVDAVTAVQRLFTPSRDYGARNLLYCDHTIHALHLEALVFAMVKRGAGSAWLDDAVAAGGARWLRLQAPLDRAERFLAGARETRFFEARTVRAADLQVGDHLIVYNHPAYAKATVGGVWKLENAVVVQTLPKLLMQGHGSPLRDRPGMWEEMVALFNAELDDCRARVEGLARVRRFGAGHVTADSARRLYPGSHIDIVSDDAEERVLAADREVTAVTGGVVFYGGASVTSTAPHRLRAARTRAGFSSDFEAVFGTNLVRRTKPERSAYDAANQRADWHLAWAADAAEEAVRTRPEQAAFVRSQQLVDYTRETVHGAPGTVGWFPLWQPSRTGGAVPRHDGRITRTEAVTVQPRNIAGWTWFFDADPAKRDLVPVLSPKEVV